MPVATSSRFSGDIWIEILQHSDLKSLIACETTCRTLRDLIHRVARLAYRKDALRRGYFPASLSHSSPHTLASALRTQDRAWQTGAFAHVATLPFPGPVDPSPYSTNSNANVNATVNADADADACAPVPVWVSGDYVLRARTAYDISSLAITRISTNERFMLSVCDPRDIAGATAVDVVVVPDGDFLIHAATVPRRCRCCGHSTRSDVVLHFRSLCDGLLFRGHWYTHRLIVPRAERVVFAACWGAYVAFTVDPMPVAAPGVSIPSTLVIYHWETGAWTHAPMDAALSNPSRNVAFIDSHHILVTPGERARSLDLYRFYCGPDTETETARHGGTMTLLRRFRLPECESAVEDAAPYAEFLPGGSPRSYSFPCSFSARDGGGGGGDEDGGGGGLGGGGGDKGEGERTAPLHAYDDIQGGLVALSFEALFSQHTAPDHFVIPTRMLLAMRRTDLRRYAASIRGTGTVAEVSTPTLEWSEWGNGGGGGGGGGLGLACLVPLGWYPPECLVLHGSRVLCFDSAGDSEGPDARIPSDLVFDFGPWLGTRTRPLPQAGAAPNANPTCPPPFALSPTKAHPTAQPAPAPLSDTRPRPSLHPSHALSSDACIVRPVLLRPTHPSLSSSRSRAQTQTLPPPDANPERGWHRIPWPALLHSHPSTAHTVARTRRHYLVHSPRFVLPARARRPWTSVCVEGGRLVVHSVCGSAEPEAWEAEADDVDIDNANNIAQKFRIDIFEPRL